MTEQPGKVDRRRNEERMLAEARTEISYADHKASMVLAALGIGFGAVMGGLLAGDWAPSDQGAGEIFWWFGAALAVGSIGLAAAAVWPRYSKGSGGSVYYWGQIAALGSFEEMCNQLDSKASTPTDRTRHQLWELSRIVASKYRLLRGALVLAAFAALMFTASAALV